MKVRFAPSPTGYLHIGNIRTALINWLYSKKNSGKFLLRIDDTDEERSEQQYEHAVFEDMAWLGLVHNETAKQSERYDLYDAAKQKLINDGRLYDCYETQEELEVKRKMLLSRGLPPIYDRAALKLTDEEKSKLKEAGRNPHWRLKLDSGDIIWRDLVRGEVKFNAEHLADPILLRADGIPTYTLSSVVDDGDLGITHIIRGEDHVSNSAVQLQLFDALGYQRPDMAHLSLIKSKDGEISKRSGGFDIRALRAEGVEPMAICSYLAYLGTSNAPDYIANLAELAENFDINNYGRAPANYDKGDLMRLNHKYIAELSWHDIEEWAKQNKIELHAQCNEKFWLAIRNNLSSKIELQEWAILCFGDVADVNPVIAEEDADYIAQAAKTLPTGDWHSSSFKEWTSELKSSTGRKGKALFMPLRLAITGREDGPELATLMPLIPRDKMIERLGFRIAMAD